ncbi:MAG: zinc ribbon domain-containing protein [Desulfobacteraceae bacterium]|nr:zinc ribbon domain-containing protein [Desulfobacteraceae bacterium]MBU4126706.1 zinc ribbon domain-containing protein [Pseudomonadota bacterium]MCG2756909.1 zinc ribbon domain-containing protein [Desulfobacteraceae bacterium]MCG2829867.1 zinc ribbon domain-containing protein [Desulfobacteraceae bacterium]
MALKKCKECGKEVSTKAKECPSCGAPVKSSSSIGCLTIIAIIFVIGMIGSLFDNDKSDKSTNNPSKLAAPKAGTPPLTTPSPVYDPIKKWGQQKVASAKKVMAIVNQDCRIYEEGPHLVIEMRMYITDPNKLFGYVRAIADSDVILHGQPRNIYFYDPSNKQIAQADTLNGVRLID